MLLFVLTFTALISYASEDIARTMVPRGKVFESFGRHFVVRTKEGTNIHVRFDLQGKFCHAFGRELNRGDEFEPGNGLLSLGTIARKLKEKGLSPEGFWTIEKDRKRGWIYEISGKMINASTSEILRPSDIDLQQLPLSSGSLAEGPSEARPKK